MRSHAHINAKALRIRLASAALGLAVCVAGVRSASAQAPNPPAGGTDRTARLLVTVVDATGAVVPGATVTVTGLDNRTKAAALAPVQSSPQGIATMSGLVLGRYTIRAEFTGLQTAVLANVTVRAGDNKQMVVLAIERQQDSVTVTQDRQASAADARGQAFGAAVTREQVEALSEDPTELQQQLADIAGPGAVIRVDSLEGPRGLRNLKFSRSILRATALPPRTTIRTPSSSTSSRSRASDRCAARSISGRARAD